MGGCTKCSTLCNSQDQKQPKNQINKVVAHSSSHNPLTFPTTAPQRINSQPTQCLNNQSKIEEGVLKLNNSKMRRTGRKKTGDGDEDGMLDRSLGRGSLSEWDESQSVRGEVRDRVRVDGWETAMKYSAKIIRQAQMQSIRQELADAKAKNNPNPTINQIPSNPTSLNPQIPCLCPQNPQTDILQTAIKNRGIKNIIPPNHTIYQQSDINIHVSQTGVYGGQQSGGLGFGVDMVIRPTSSEIFEVEESGEEAVPLLKSSFIRHKPMNCQQILQTQDNPEQEYEQRKKTINNIVRVSQLFLRDSTRDPIVRRV